MTMVIQCSTLRDGLLPFAVTEEHSPPSAGPGHDLSHARGAQVGTHNVQHNNHHYYPPPLAPLPPRFVPPVAATRPARPANPRRRAVVALAIIAVLAAVGFGVQQAITYLGSLPDLGGEPARQIIQDATGPGPWTVEGYGYRYTIEKVVRTSHDDQFTPRGSLTLTGYVTVTAKSRFVHKEYQFRDQADNLLEGVPFQGEGTGDPPLNQRTKLVSVIWDAKPRASRLTVTIHDFYWPAGRDLILRGVPVG
jgi:hypothetical protein